jgi:hypothetical protein
MPNSNSLLQSSASMITKRSKTDKPPLNWRYGAGAVVATVIAATGIYQATRPHETIRSGENLVQLVGLDAAITLAEKNAQPIKIDSPAGRFVTHDYALARALKPFTDDFGIVVTVYAGDKIDLRWGRWSYTPALN